MSRYGFVFGLCLLLSGGGVPGAQEVLRGEVRVALEPVYAPFVDVPVQPDTQSLQRRALEEAVVFYSAMIYGWSFYYDIGEKARGIAEVFELTPAGTIEFGDPGLYATDARVQNGYLNLYTDYWLSGAQKRRMDRWKSGTIQNAQATGYGPPGGPVEISDWQTIKETALKDAARAAVRATLRGSERNRPKEARGFICLAAFPVFRMDGAQWAASARFRVEITEIVPFAAY
jgi:hypothetical protein